MSFQEHLENLRAKPEHIRKRFSFFASFSITAIIFVFWLGSFGVFGSPSNGTVAATAKKIATPGQSLVASVGSFFTDIKDIIFGPKTVTFSTVEVTPGRK